MTQPVVTFLGLCRACGSPKLQRFVHLPQMPFTDDFIPATRFGHEFRADIDVFICRECLVAQTQHDVEVRCYYEDYQYSVSRSPTANRFMQLLARNLQASYYPECKDKKVLEIGSGDGEQLLAFKNTGCRVFGYEPSLKLCQIAEEKGIPTIQGLFSANSVDKLPVELSDVDVVMLSYTFDHLPRPRAFLSACKSILNKTDGLLVVEVHDLEKIIERREYCLFEHEHSIYLTEATAQRICRMEGFEILDFDLVRQEDRRANSLIFVATPQGSRLSARSVEPRTSPDMSCLDLYDTVGVNVLRGIANLEQFVEIKTARGRKLAGYGAGGRGVMSLAAMCNASKLRYLVDKKPKRPSLVAPKSGISLVGVDSLRSDPVDDVLVFSFGYMAEIQAELALCGYKPEQFHSLLDILAGRFSI